VGLEKNKMDPEKNVVASLALHAVLEPVFKEVSRYYSTWRRYIILSYQTAAGGR
jgi:hypothetical protein